MGMLKAICAAMAAVWLALGAAGTAAAEPWLRAESDNFVVYADWNEAAVRRYVEKLETFDAFMRWDRGLPQGTPPARKLPIYLVRNVAEMRKAAPWFGPSDSVAGFYSAHDEEVFALAIRDRIEDDYVMHEYVHHFMLNNFPYSYPRWLVEGYAEYFMTFAVKDSIIEVGDYNEWRAASLVRESWISPNRLFSAQPGLKTDHDRQMFYAQAWIAAHYFLSDPGRKEQLASYVRAVGKGEEPLAALANATGRSVDSMARTLRDYADDGIKVSRFKSEPFRYKGDVRITVLPPSADDVLLPAVLSRYDLDVTSEDGRRYADDLMKTLRAAALRHPGDRDAKLALARAEVKYGDRAAGEALLDEILKGAPQDVDAMLVHAISRLLTAEALEKAGDAAAGKAARNAAIGHLNRAFRVDPNRYEVLMRMASARRTDPGYPSDNAVQALINALQIAPGVRRLRLDTARALLRKDRREEARIVLEPLVYDPHAGALAEQARTLLEEAASGAAPAAAPVAAPADPG